MMAAEAFHHRSFIQELDAFAEAGGFVNGFHSYARLQLSLHDVLGDPFVHHAKGALPQLPEQSDLVSWNLPFVRDIDCGAEGNILELGKYPLKDISVAALCSTVDTNFKRRLENPQRHHQSHAAALHEQEATQESSLLLPSLALRYSGLEDA